MASTSDIYGTVFKGGTATLLARVVGNAEPPIVRADTAQIAYSIFLLDDDDPNRRDAVPGHDDVALGSPRRSAISFRPMPCWTVDAIGYNFCHTPDVSGGGRVSHGRTVLPDRIPARAGQRPGDPGAIPRECDLRKGARDQGPGTRERLKINHIPTPVPHLTPAP